MNFTATLWCAALLWGMSLVSAYKGDEEALIGWKGASFEPTKVFSNQQPATPDAKAQWIEHIAWSPRAFLYHNFLSHEEADYLIRLAKPKMMRSTVEGGKKNDGIVDNVRTSYGTFLRRMSDPVIKSVEEKLSQWTHLNVSHQEDIQILRYSVGQKYGEHYDTLMEGSPRVCTAIVYLTDVDEGGETAFPHESAEWVDPDRGRELGPFSDCANGHVATKAKKGDALLFFTFNPEGVQDTAALHTGCPVIHGVKWTATIWIHSQPFRPEELVDAEKPRPEDTFDPAECSDLTPNCKQWVDSGECNNNPGYMRGDSGTFGHCRLSCGVCTQCDPGDDACRAKNRAQAGFLSLGDNEL